MISKKLGVAKSTLSNWLQKIPYKPNKEVQKRISRKHLKMVSIRKNQKSASIAKMKKLAKKELGKLTKRDLWLLGIGLYLGEGTKKQEAVQITNSDPKTIRLTIKWLKKICGLNTANFHIAIHTYPDNDLEETINFWSIITGVPKNQFGKTQIDRRVNKSTKKKNTLPYGTIRLSVRANGQKDFGVNLHRRIMGWIETSFKQI